jgi:hypothetical protein
MPKDSEPEGRNQPERRQRMKIDRRSLRMLVVESRDNWYKIKREKLIVYYQGKHYFVYPSASVEGYYSVLYYVKELGAFEDFAATFEQVLEKIKADQPKWEMPGYWKNRGEL